MTREDQHHSPGFSRRTALKAAAWSVPVVAAAAAVPAHAASGDTVDLAVSGMPFGNAFEAFSPDRLHSYSLAIPGGMEVSNLGSVDVAAGALFTVSFDARVLGEPSVYLDNQGGDALPSAGSSTSGNVTTVSFLLPALPAGGEPLAVYGDFGIWPGQDETDNWYEDVEPYTVTVSSTQTDSNPSNNTTASPAIYTDTVDGAVSVEWGEASIPNANDPESPFTVDVPQTITIDSLTPGGTTTQTSFSFSSPRGYAPSGDPEFPSTLEYLFEEVSITSVLLDGVDIASELSDESSNGFANFWLRSTPITAGQQLVITVDVKMRDGALDGLSGGGGVRVLSSMYPDRDPSNNDADSPRYED